jgi:hypothetical protein
LPTTISPIRRCGTPISFAKRYCDNAIGLRNSSSNISPGETGASFIFLAMANLASVVINNLNVFRTARRPAETDTKLVVDANTPLPGTITRKFL